jgi:uncharacterized RDD family membrane protein YckC
MHLFRQAGVNVRKKKNHSGEPCKLIRRLAAILYDATIVLALLMLSALLAMLLGMGQKTAFRDPGFTLYLLFVWFLYITWCWHQGGMTVGMRAWRIRIEDDLGCKPSWGKTIVRFLASLLSAALLGAGFLWSMVDSRNRTWHDIVSGTRLVRF